MKSSENSLLASAQLKALKGAELGEAFRFRFVKLVTDLAVDCRLREAARGFDDRGPAIRAASVLSGSCLEARHGGYRDQKM